MCTVVDQYLDYGVDVSVKSIITPGNVDRLCEMVEQLHQRFAAVKSYKLQIVEDDAMLPNGEAMNRFYHQFTDHYFRARQLGKQYGIDVYVLAHKYMDMLIEHYCGGEMCVTPQGTISVCHRVSSESEPQYEKYVYGRITDDLRVEVDEDKFRMLMSHDIAHDSRCNDCFARWHCGGGCMAQYDTYRDKQRLSNICHWTRSFMLKVLLDRYLENEQ